MRRAFRWRPAKLTDTQRTPRFWLQLTVAALALANLALLVLYFFPPGGSREELAAEGQRLRNERIAAAIQSTRLRNVSSKVQLGGEQAADFEAKYILPKRVAYGAVIEEIQRLAGAASMVPREGVYTEEPIEGTSDLSVLNVTANFEGSYSNLMQFLYEADHSPMLLMLESLQASPEKDGRIASAARFQAIIRDDLTTGATAGPQQP